MKKLNEKLIVPAERFSNHAVQAFATEECPHDRACYCIGFGKVHHCKFLTKNLECLELEDT